ncbi:MAG: NAD-binding protein, partial [Bacteroidia bacterium]|nr:NAD-binding protein [Bacteroidia bacterium]
LFAKLAKVYLTNSDGILIIGASKSARLIGDYLRKNDRHVVLIDNNERNIEHAKKLGVEAIVANIFSDTLTDNIELNDVGFLFAMTGNDEINTYAIEKFKNVFGENGSFRLINEMEMNDPLKNPKEGLFSKNMDFVTLNEITRQFPAVFELEIKNEEHYEKLIKIIEADENVAPIFVKDVNGQLKVLSQGNGQGAEVREAQKLVCIGKMLDIDMLAEARKVN